MNRQTAFWNHYTIHDTHRSAQADRPKRSENRQRTERVHVRLLPSEYEALAYHAGLLNISVAELVRWSALEYVKFFGHCLLAQRERTAATTEADRPE
jgi:hypothetical protein